MHLYVHVPFCRRRCSYCDFAIAVRRRVPGAEFVAAIQRELALRLPPVGGRGPLPAPGSPGGGGPLPTPRSPLPFVQPLRTVYLGGGTPSLLAPEHLAALLASLRSEVGLAPDVECTIEANPDDVTPGAADAWLAAGVTRVSLGVQSLRPTVLQWMHRTHSADDAVEALRRLRAAGVSSLSADIIFGLPESLDADPVADVRRVLECGVDHVSAYGLTVEAGTAVGKWTRRGHVKHVADEAYAEEFLAIHEVLADDGFEHYEVSNYARPGCRSRHNQVYWSGGSYVGLGPSAHSFAGRVRRWNLREWTQYHRAVQGGADPLDGEEQLSPAQRELEAWYLGLRTVEGLRLPESRQDRAPSLQAAVDRGWLRIEGDTVRATVEGWLRLDALVASLTTSREGG